MRVGYGWMVEQSGIVAPPPERIAELRSVTRIEHIGPCIAVPAAVAPAQDDWLAQLLFALKHEGVELSILAQCLPLIEESALLAALEASPTSQYLRKACYLWEHFTGRELATQPSAARSNYVPLFDPKHYITNPDIDSRQRSTRWRIVFNGLGSLTYCVTVRKTSELTELLAKNPLQQARDFTDALPPDILVRSLAWAYLDETRNSYALENEVPSGDKAQRFVQLLKQAHVQRRLDEDYLVELQNAAISNVFYQAASYRTEQNYLSSGLRGALGVTYVPPAPELSRELMQHLMALANQPPEGLDPLVLAAIVSFGFVFIHPFMDGNGRLSRFLFHQVLCQRGALSNGLLLPVSAVLKQQESSYKNVLEAWSAPTRQSWDVSYIDEEQFAFDFKGHPAIYRYWDATRCVGFMAAAAEESIEKHLKQESEYLSRYDAIYQRINSSFDIANSDLSKLVMFCLDQHGTLSAHRRKQYQYKVPTEVFDALQQAYREVLASASADANGGADDG